MDRRLIAVVTICLVVIIGCGWGIKARGEAAGIPDITNEYYREIEKAFTDQVKERLNDNGFQNAGVSMTKVVGEDGIFNYTVAVHHRRIDKMNEYQRAQISAIIISDGVAVKDSKVSVRYIEY